VFDIAGLRVALGSVADLDRAPAMTAYMRGRFAFLGVASPERRAAAKRFVAAGADATAADLLSAADRLWQEPEREFQYVACDLLRRWVRMLDATSLARIETLIRTKQWWDTVDTLASNVVGAIVLADRDVGANLMDAWIHDDDIWIARTALLHQLKYRGDTDPDRLFDYVERRAGDTEFFIRKACGWALREYATTHPDAVREFVEGHRDRLSGLTIREATKHL
jgi:3-methyladenine DNA glycosylase AlkD